MSSKLEMFRQQWTDPDFWTKWVPEYIRRKSLIPTLPPDIYWYHIRDGGYDILSEDWDNIFILDCCRHDAFEELVGEEIDYRISKGSSTTEFVKKNFTDGEYYDVVYVSANPHVKKHANDRFHDVISVWENGWDGEKNTVMPSTVADAVKDATKEYPNKRIIAHFVQPHIPFIGPAAADLPVGASIQNARNTELNNNTENVTTAYEAHRQSKISDEDIWTAYMESLEIAFEKVADLLETMEGKNVVTADHGDMFGEFAWAALGRYTGHKNRLPTKPLIKVPWYEVQNGPRKTVSEEEPNTQSNSEVDESEVKEKLSHLGYLDQ